MVTIDHMANNLYRTSDGIWMSQKNRAISFPEDQRGLKFDVEDQSFWYRHRNTCILQALQNFPPRELFLDIGGGNGYVTSAIQEQGAQTILIEPGIEGARNAKTRGIRHIICAPLEDANLEANTIPAAGLFDVLEHIEDDLGFLNQIRSLLTENGRLFLTVPAHLALWSAVDEFSGHHRRYSLNEISDKLRQTGFQIEYTTYFFSFLTLPIFLLRSLPSRAGLLQAKDIQDTTKDDRVHPAVEKLFSLFMQHECSKIKQRQKIHLGTSCLCVVKKTSACKN